MKLRILIFTLSYFHISTLVCFSQLKWQNVDSEFQPLPPSIHVYKCTDSLYGKPNIAYYIEADIKDKQLDFTMDTTYKRRLTPNQFHNKNEKPLVVVNTTFFSFTTNQNLNVVIKDGKMVGYNVHTINGRGKDTFTYRHPFGSAIGISKKRRADIAWLYTDSSKRLPRRIEYPEPAVKDSSPYFTFKQLKDVPITSNIAFSKPFSKWKMQTAVGGGPVLVQRGAIVITNEQELKFTGKAINDKHPRTAMGHTLDNKLIILVVQGRFPGIAEGATLEQLAKIFIDLKCVEAMNLDGGGSSCMLVNGKETIKPSDAGGQRPVPAVFVIKQRK